MLLACDCCLLRMFVVLCYSQSYFLSLFFFFFKQKTAYEMRISDWSSDVCSSDLQQFHELLGGLVALVALDEHFLDILVIDVADRALDEVAVRMDQRRRARR